MTRRDDELTPPPAPLVDSVNAVLSKLTGDRASKEVTALCGVLDVELRELRRRAFEEARRATDDAIRFRVSAVTTVSPIDPDDRADKPDRDIRQVVVSRWAAQAFGVEQATSLPQRGIRLLEEAVEAAQAAGVDRGTARTVLEFVFDRPPGQLGQELGGVGVTVLALAQAAGLSAEAEEEREVERVLSKPVAEFAQRNAAKNAAGLVAPGMGTCREDVCPGCGVMEGERHRPECATPAPKP